EKLGSLGTSAAVAVASGSANSTPGVFFSCASAAAADDDGTVTVWTSRSWIVLWVWASTDVSADPRVCAATPGRNLTSRRVGSPGAPVPPARKRDATTVHATRGRRQMRAGREARRCLAAGESDGMGLLSADTP